MSGTVHSAANASNPLRRWRLEHHVTQAQLAADMRVDASLVSQWEKGYSIPSLRKFHELQRHTGVGVHSLLHFFVPLAPGVGGSVVIRFPGSR